MTQTWEGKMDYTDGIIICSLPDSIILVEMLP